jgi:hypothetical protein
MESGAVQEIFLLERVIDPLFEIGFHKSDMTMNERINVSILK